MGKQTISFMLVDLEIDINMMEGNLATSIKILNAHTFDSTISLLRIHPTKSCVCVKSRVKKVVTAALFLIIKFGNNLKVHQQWTS